MAYALSPELLLPCCCAALSTAVLSLPRVFPRGPHARFAYLTHVTGVSAFLFHVSLALSSWLAHPWTSAPHALASAAPLVHGLALAMAAAFYGILAPRVDLRSLPAWAWFRVHYTHATPALLSAAHLCSPPALPYHAGPAAGALVAAAFGVAAAYTAGLHLDAWATGRGFVYGFLDRMSGRQRAAFFSAAAGIFAAIVVACSAVLAR